MLFVEDESIVREGITSTLQEVFDLDIFAAEDGQTGWGLFQQENPDIVISDIRMPIMDGLELLRRISLTNHKPYTIILTAHADFNYAQSAIRHGVHNFLIKPVSYDELISHVQKAIEAMNVMNSKEQEQSKLVHLLGHYEEELRKKDLLDCLHGIKPIPVQLKATSVIVTILHFDYSWSPFKLGDAGLLVFAVENIANEILKEENYNWTLLVENDCRYYLVLIFKKHFSAQENYNRHVKAERCVAKIIDVLGLLLRVNAVSFVSPLRNGSELHQAYKEGAQQIFERLQEQPIRAVNETTESGDLSFSFISNEERSLITAIREQRMEEMGQLIRFIVKRVEQDHEQLKSLCFRILYFICGALQEEGGLRCITYFQSLSVVRQINSHRNVVTLSKWLESVLLEFTRHYHSNTPRSNHPVITRIEEKVLEDVSRTFLLKDLAIDLGMSPNYISELFHKEVGENFTDFVIQLKMEKAKSRLLIPNMKVYEVAIELGYTDGRHFSQMFRRFTGLTPKQYQVQGGSGHDRR